MKPHPASLTVVLENVRLDGKEGEILHPVRRTQLESRIIISDGSELCRAHRSVFFHLYCKELTLEHGISDLQKTMSQVITYEELRFLVLPRVAGQMASALRTIQYQFIIETADANLRTEMLQSSSVPFKERALPFPLLFDHHRGFSSMSRPIFYSEGDFRGD
jgi:hypothetical protein